MYNKDELILVQEHHEQREREAEIADSREFLIEALKYITYHPGKRGVYFRRRLHPEVKEDAIEYGYHIREGMFSFTYVSLDENCPTSMMVKYSRPVELR